MLCAHKLSSRAQDRWLLDGIPWSPQWEHSRLRSNPIAKMFAAQRGDKETQPQFAKIFDVSPGCLVTSLHGS